MAIASGARHSAYYIEEEEYGVTPENPAWTQIRLRPGMSLGLTKEAFESEEINDTRQVSDLRHGTRQAQGEIPVELSPLSFDDFLAAVLCGTWDTDTDTLKVGQQRRSYTIERHFADIGQYLRYKGVEINSMNLTVTPSGIVQAGFSVLGQGMDNPDTQPLAGATYLPRATTSPYDGFGGSLTEGGTPVAVVSEIALTIENGMQPVFVIGSRDSLRPSIDKLRVTGTVTAYFENAVLYEKFLNETETSLSFTLGTGTAGQGLRFTIPRLKYSGGQPDSVAGPIPLAMGFTGTYDPVEETTIIIERNV